MECKSSKSCCKIASIIVHLTRAYSPNRNISFLTSIHQPNMIHELRGANSVQLVE
jgi:hypothetical protein